MNFWWDDGPDLNRYWCDLCGVPEKPFDPCPTVEKNFAEHKGIIAINDHLRKTWEALT